MDKKGFLRELLKRKQELINEVIEYYSAGDEERGRMEFTRWQERFISLLSDSVPNEVHRFTSLTFIYAAVAKYGEPPLERFMRTHGNKHLAFIDELTESINKGRVKVEKKSKVQPNTAGKIQADPTKATIAVITALPDELDFLLDMPFNWSEPKTLNGINYNEGDFLNDQTKIIATNAGGMGLVSMAIVTTKVLTAWSPSIAAAIGICGGRKEKRLGLGDIVVANKCFHYQFGSIEDGKFARELVSENVNQEVLNIAENFKRTSVLNEIQNMPARGFKKPNTVLQCHIGPMGSADLVVKDVEKLGAAVDADRKTIAVDMESYAFMHAAVKAKTPLSFVVKSVSDFADTEKDDEYRDYAKFTATEFFKRIAKTLIT